MALLETTQLLLQAKKKKKSNLKSRKYLQNKLGLPAHPPEIRFIKNWL